MSLIIQVQAGRRPAWFARARTRSSASAESGFQFDGEVREESRSSTHFSKFFSLTSLLITSDVLLSERLLSPSQEGPDRGRVQIERLGDLLIAPAIAA